MLAPKQVRLLASALVSCFLLPNTALAKCSTPRGEIACEAACSGSNACVIVMTGAGGAKQEDFKKLRDRIAASAPLGVRDGQIVIFEPTGGVRDGLLWWTPADRDDVRRFVSKRRGLGTNLNFLVSSAAALQFENYIWDELPNEVGTVIINQPFSSPTAERRRPLSLRVRPRHVVIYTIPFSAEEKRLFDAGPTRFVDNSVRWEHLVLDSAHFGQSAGANVLSRHGAAVGPGEEMAFGLFPPRIGPSPFDSSVRVRSQLDKVGIPELSTLRDPIPNYWTSNDPAKSSGQAHAEADSMSRFVKGARKVLIVGRGPGAIRAYKNLGHDKAHWAHDIVTRDEAFRRAEMIGADAVLGFESNPRSADNGRKSSIRGGVHADVPVSDADFAPRQGIKP
jgi:hypothetical protein